MPDEIARARVHGDGEDRHPSLFPQSQWFHEARSPQTVCRGLGLNWLAARKLHERGWLSFDPHEIRQMGPAQEAELTFLGALVVAGCDDGVLESLLAGLPKPYAYRLNRIHYDWASRTWRMLEDVERFEERFEEWIEDLVAWQELRELERFRDAVEHAIERLKERRQRERAVS